MGEVAHLSTVADVKRLAEVRGSLLEAARRDKRVSDCHYRIYSEALLSFTHWKTCEHFGRIWPAPSTIARLVGKDERTVQRALKAMTSRGYLQVVSVGGGRLPNGRPATTIYALPGSTTAPEPGLITAPEPELTPALPPPNLIEVNLTKKTLPSGSVSARARGKRRQHDEDDDEGTRLASDWQPDEVDIAFAEQQGLDPAEVADRFRDHYLSTGRRSCDWAATWRFWCRGDAKRLQQQPPRDYGRIGNILAAARELSDEARQRKANPLDQVHHALGPQGDMLLQLIGPDFRRWFLDIEIDAAGQVATVFAPTRFKVDNIRQRFEAQIRSAWGVEHVDFKVRTVINGSLA